MEIVRYAIVGETGIVLACTACESAALTSMYFAQGCTIVKMVGEIPKPKKPKLMAPCLHMCGDRIGISGGLLESEQEAKAIWKDQFVSWPAVANAEGFYEVME